MFFIVNAFHHTSRKTSLRDVEVPETLESLGSFKVSVSILEAAMSRLGLVSDKILNAWDSSRPRRHGSRVLSQSRAHSCQIMITIPASRILRSQISKSRPSLLIPNPSIGGVPISGLQDYEKFIKIVLFQESNDTNNKSSHLTNKIFYAC